MFFLEMILQLIGLTKCKHTQRTGDFLPLMKSSDVPLQMFFSLEFSLAHLALETCRLLVVLFTCVSIVL